MRWLGLVILVALAACTRPLTPNETKAARGLFGDTLNTDAVRVTAGVGLLPLPRDRQNDRRAESSAASPAAAPASPPPGLCTRKRSTRRYYDWPAAFVLNNTVFFSHRFYTADAFAGLPESALYPTSVLMAHELVHVWQWQNRRRTAYTPQGAASETFAKVDPYWFGVDRGADFFAMGYEQQAAMVQDFVCYALFEPNDPKRDELAAVLRPALPVDRFLAALR